MACLKGFEPLTYWFVASHSIQLSYRHIALRLNKYTTTRTICQEEIFENTKNVTFHKKQQSFPCNNIIYVHFLNFIFFNLTLASVFGIIDTL